MRLGILSSHPIQYQAPWFRGLAQQVDLEVFFAHRQTAADQGKAGFGVAFDWDVDLLSGYQHRFLKNVAPHPGVEAYAGCDTPEIESVVRDAGFDAFIVCGWYLKSYLQAAQACRRARVPVLVRGDSQLGTPRSLLKRFLMEFRQRWLLRKFDGFLSVGKRHAEYLRHFGVPEGRIFFVPHFVDNEWFAQRAAAGREKRAEIRKTWGAGETDLVALFAGKFRSLKRPQDLLGALAVLKRQAATDFVAVFAGAGERETELRTLAAQEKLRVHFIGFKNQSELPAVYAAGDVLVLPSESETWGLAVNEAMACGLPAIVSDAVGGAPDLIQPGKTGFTFPVGDVGQLGERLLEIQRLKRARHDFFPALKELLQTYSVTTAVAGTVQATKAVRSIA